MDGYLRQSTASQSRAIGPFVDDTDFKTTKTGLTIANTDIKLVANGAASANKNSGGGTHRANGEYGVTFDATDTATVGELAVSVVVSGALPVFHKWTVLEEAEYDARFAASALGYVTDQPVNAAKVGGTSQTGRDIGASVLLSSGTGTGQVSLSSGTVTLTDASLTAAKIGADAITAAKIADGAIDAATFAAGAINATAIAADAITAAKIADGAIDAATFAAGAINAAAIAADAIGASELAADAVTEIAAGVLSAATSAPIPANIKKVNDVTIVGDGAGTPWGP